MVKHQIHSFGIGENNMIQLAASQSSFEFDDNEPFGTLFDDERTYGEQAQFEMEVIHDLKECIDDFLSFADVEDLFRLIVKELN
jgi:hypothetical protein